MTSLGILTPRWSSLRFHPVQNALWNTQSRFATVPAGRRSGKTEIAKRRLVIAALEGTQYDNARFFAAAPTYAQAKRIFWDDLKALIPPQFFAGKASEAELVIPLINGSEIHVIGMDKPERIEGSPWDGGVLTEIANMKPIAWPANVRPALADRQGWALLEGVPEGMNHYYDLDQRAQSDPSGEWASYHWKSADVLPASEIEAARRDLDELTFEQEYEASFLNFSGRAYYPFDRRLHCAPLKYDPKQTLIFTFDFNIEPGTAAVLQEQRLPGQYERDSKGNQLLDKPIIGTGIIGEVHIPRNSNTPAVCARLIKDWGAHQGKVKCHGDSTGGAGGTAKVTGSDWDIIRRDICGHFGDRARILVTPANPRERVRLNAMNTRLLNGAGEIRMMIDPAKAPHVIKDFEGVKLLEGGSGEIDKKATPQLTHLTDGIGYYIADEFPIRTHSMGITKVIGV